MGAACSKAMLSKDVEELIAGMIATNVAFALDQVEKLLASRKSYDAESRKRIWHLHDIAIQQVKREYAVDEVKQATQ